jgi:hypothetical protein
MLRQRINLLLSTSTAVTDPARTFALETADTVVDADRPSNVVDWITLNKPAAASLVALDPATSSGNSDQPATDLIGLTLGNPANPAIFLQAAIHGTELSSMFALMRILNLLAAPSGPNAALWQELIDNLFFVAIPCVNPAGYQPSPLWPNGHRKCPNYTPPGAHVGTDANRNYDHLWDSDTGTTPSADAYKGAAALELPEVQTSVDFFTDNTPFAALDMHSGGVVSVGIDRNQTVFASHYGGWCARRKAELQDLYDGIIDWTDWNVTASPTATGWFSQQLASDGQPVYGQLLEVGCSGFASPRTSEVEISITAALVLCIRWLEAAQARGLI